MMVLIWLACNAQVRRPPTRTRQRAPTGIMSNKPVIIPEVGDDDTVNGGFAAFGTTPPILPGLPPGAQFIAPNGFYIPCQKNCPAVPKLCPSLSDICGEGCFCRLDPTLRPTQAPTMPTPRPTSLAPTAGPGMPTRNPSIAMPVSKPPIPAVVPTGGVPTGGVPTGGVPTMTPTGIFSSPTLIPYIGPPTNPTTGLQPVWNPTNSPVRPMPRPTTLPTRRPSPRPSRPPTQVPTTSRPSSLAPTAAQTLFPSGVPPSLAPTSSSVSAQSADSSSGSLQMSSGSIAGIIVGVLVVLVVIGYYIWTSGPSKEDALLNKLAIAHRFGPPLAPSPNTEYLGDSEAAGDTGYGLAERESVNVDYSHTYGPPQPARGGAGVGGAGPPPYLHGHASIRPTTQRMSGIPAAGSFAPYVASEDMRRNSMLPRPLSTAYHPPPQGSFGPGPGPGPPGSRRASASQVKPQQFSPHPPSMYPSHHGHVGRFHLSDDHSL